jgi:FKBP-type peptidyl-prolyl cis-trans isomerase
MRRIRIFLLVIPALFFSCKKGRELKTDSGFRYILFTESKGNKASPGDYITMSMKYRDEKDSVLFDSDNNGGDIRFRLEKIPFKGSYEEGITYLAENDSARFFVPADSLYNYLYKQRGADMIPQEQTSFKPGSFLKFDIKILKIQTEASAEEEILLEAIQKEKEEQEALAGYIRRSGITVPPDSAGYYLLIREKGNGPAVDSGKVITVDYEGRFLNDSVFDGTRKEGKPYKFISGSRHVIAGWEKAMKQLRGGDKVTLIVPSRLAYGESGIRDPKTGSFLVPPYTPLVFDIEILEVDDLPGISGR